MAIRSRLLFRTHTPHAWTVGDEHETRDGVVWRITRIGRGTYVASVYGRPVRPVPSIARVYAWLAIAALNGTTATLRGAKGETIWVAFYVTFAIFGGLMAGLAYHNVMECRRREMEAR